MVNSEYSRLKKGDILMDSFVLAGKARTVFKLVELLAKAEKEQKASKKGNKK